jgi:hypothetical protein
MQYEHGIMRECEDTGRAHAFQRTSRSWVCAKGGAQAHSQHALIAKKGYNTSSVVQTARALVDIEDGF